MSLSIKLGNFLYRHAFFAYKPLYFSFKKKQDAFEIALLENYVKPGSQVIDIGANIGFYAQLLSSLCGPKGHVHCFEPDPVNYGHLLKTVSGLSNTSCYNKAISASNGTLSIYTSKELNVDHRTYKPEEYEKEITVEAITLDHYIKTSALTHVDVIKMDIQGFESEALNGMKGTLAMHPDIILISEFWPYGLKQAGSSAGGYFAALQSLGFNCYLMEKQSLVLLDADRVNSLQGLDKKHYFNIVATRGHV